MAKAFYIGVDGKARLAKKMYIGVDGKAHKVKKVYAGVDGKARLAYQSYIPVTGIKLTWRIGGFDGEKHNGEKYVWQEPTKFTATITPENATDKTLKWSLSGNCTGTKINNTEYSVSPGSSGQAILTVQSADGPTVRVQITMKYGYVSTYSPQYGALSAPTTYIDSIEFV
ncbi:MAG: hypothetical protein KH014_04905 [Subdoligranulum variabile]|jgi:hypothetical protein|nr:hypothetical protein [Subdoligranulum variabile]